MRFGCVVRPKAGRDIDDIADYLAEQAGLDTALRFLSEIDETFALLATQRDMGWRCKVRDRRLRSSRVFRVSSRFDRFLIVFQPYQDRIEIVRVLHGAQDLEEILGRHGVE